MKSLSCIVSDVHESATLAVDSLAKKLKAEGKDVVAFAAGEPDFNTPENISNIGVSAIINGRTKYTPAAGLEDLRKSVCSRLRQDFGLEYEPSNIVAASGAKHNIYVALMTLLNPGDEVVLPVPYWVTYYEAIKMAGGVPVVVETSEDTSFKMTAKQLESAITDKTKLLVLNNPSNPSGIVYSREELVDIADICEKADIYVMSDEIYCNLLYDGVEFVSFPSLSESIRERTILINGISKSYAMTGWRIGYAAANKTIANAMSNFLSHSTGGPSTISQYAAIEALSGSQESVNAMSRIFAERREYILSRLDKIPALSYIRPHGAFYVIVNVSQFFGRTIGNKLIKNSDDFALALLEQQSVALVPCASFGIPDYVRLTYATSIAEIEKGMDRIEAFLNS